MTNLNRREANPTTTSGVTKAAPRTPSQVANTEVRGVTPKDMEVGTMVEEINVYSLIP